jgi:hypothetical protein
MIHFLVVVRHFVVPMAVTILGVTAAAMAQPVTLAVGYAEGFPGAVVNVPISISGGSSNVGGLQVGGGWLGSDRRKVLKLWSHGTAVGRFSG